MGAEKIQDHGLPPGRKDLTQEVTSLRMGMEWKEDLKISLECLLIFQVITFIGDLQETVEIISCTCPDLHLKKQPREGQRLGQGHTVIAFSKNFSVRGLALILMRCGSSQGVVSLRLKDLHICKVGNKLQSS